MGAPTLESSSEGVDVVILGIPYDIATHPSRVGSRLGPDHIRFQSTPERQFLTDASQTGGHGLRIIDAGNVPVIPGEAESAYIAVEARIEAVLDSGAIPLSLGGDGAITLPQLRATARAHAGLVVLHFDAHTDCYPVPDDAPFTNATTFVHAASEGLVIPGQSFHLGVRGTSTIADAPDVARGLGYTVLTTAALQTPTVEDVVDGIKAAVGDRPVFLSFDMDVFDPSVAPGVCTPEWGGLSAAEGIRLIRALSGLRIVAADVNTVSPPHDPAGLTASLAARIVQEILHILRPTESLPEN